MVPYCRSSWARGAYVLFDGPAPPEVILLATGSEVELAMGAARALTAERRRVRVVSLPSVDAFEAQDQAYRDTVLPPAVRKRVAIEARIGDHWYKFVGLDGKVMGLPTFGRGAPGSGLRALRVHDGGHRPHPARVGWGNDYAGDSHQPPT
ncbi:MAG: transketolase-like TK C-terminal-containing protein [Gammaproteobacteria bacterium]